MLEKYLGWFTGTLLLIIFSIAIFPQGFQIVINWFGPVFGQFLTPTLMLVFVLIAPAIKYSTVLVAYVISGFACGAVGKGGIKRSILLAVLVFLTLFLVIAANVFPIAKVFVFSSFKLTSFPSTPPGTSIIDLLSLPLVSDYLPSILENMFRGASDGMDVRSDIFLGVAVLILINMLINFIILCISSIIGGLTTSKILPRFRKKKTSASPSNLNQKIAALSIASLILCLQISIASCNMPKKFDSTFKGSLVTQELGGILEMLRGDFIWTIIQNDGSLSLICGYGSLDPADIAVSLSSTDLQGIIFAGFIVRSGELTLPEGIPQELQQFLPFIPNQGFIVLSIGSESETQIQTVVSRFEAALRVHFRKITDLQIPMENIQLNVVIYDVSGDMTIENSYETFRSILPENGVLSLIAPDKVVSKPFVALAGIINLKTIGELGLEIDGDEELIVLAINYVELDRNYFTGTSTFKFSLQEILGFSTPISSNLPNGSYIVVTVPENVNISSLTVNPERVEVHGNTVVLRVNPGESYNDLQIGFVARFPPKIVITKTVSSTSTSADGTVTVTVTIQNLGDTTVNNVVLNDSRTIASYPLTAYIISGQIHRSWAQLEPNETQTISYVIKVTSNGVYTLTPAIATYSSEFGEQQKESEKIVIISNFNLGKYLSELFTDQTFVVNPFVLIFSLAIIIPPVVEAVKTFLKRKPSISTPATTSDIEQTA
ncbi:MAG: hypothetical protein QXR63_02185 [Candidatus Bathyarchaeia archaeon]